MRAPKSFPGSSCYQLCIVAIVMCLIVLLALLTSWFQNRIYETNATVDFQYPVSIPSKGDGNPPILAYWIFGTRGDGRRILRLLNAIYHPRNKYLLQLEAESSDHERAELVLKVKTHVLFRAFRNVKVVGRSYAVNRMGPSALASTLHAAALLLKLCSDWDWFINLSASDYPLMSQDDLLHAITSLPKDLNFIHYSNDSNWKKQERINQIIVDPSLHLQKSSHLYYAVETRTTPDTFNIYGGSPWLILTREFLQYCVQAWENTPRKLLMYFANTANPLHFYFHTVVCNSPEFKNRIISTNLRYSILSNPSDGKPLSQNMVSSGAAFAGPLHEGDMEILNELDKALNRKPDTVVPGDWCFNEKDTNVSRDSLEIKKDSCSNSGNIDGVRPGPYGVKLELLLSKLATEGSLRTNQCHDPLRQR